MIKLKEILTEAEVSRELWYHINNDISLEECVFRYGSPKYFTLINEARLLACEENIKFESRTRALLETDLGKFGVYEGEEVALDFPMLTEAPKKRKKTHQLENQNEVVLKHTMFMLEILKLKRLKKYHLVQVV